METKKMTVGIVPWDDTVPVCLVELDDEYKNINTIIGGYYIPMTAKPFFIYVPYKDDTSKPNKRASACTKDKSVYGQAVFISVITETEALLNSAGIDEFRRLFSCDTPVVSWKEYNT